MADDLYALPPGDFTRARDERAKALRKEGRREEADAVKALRKPSVAAWAVNQLARRRAKAVERLLAAGEELRAAQEELLGGGDRRAFQSAAARERDEVAKLVGEAVELVAEAGERATPALREKIAETLHAAALDEETAGELRAGRLVREREAIGGFGGIAEGAKSTQAPRKGKREAPKKASDDEAKRVAAARTDERHARRELEAADKAAAHAETRAEAAKAHAEEANARAKTTVERLKEARRERAAAKKAHARAERTLKAAEGGS